MSYQDAAIDQFIGALEKTACRYPRDGWPEHFQALAGCLDFWRSVRDRRRQIAHEQATSQDHALLLANAVEPAVRSYGQYVVVRTTASLSTGEWTNIGVIVYDKEGQQVYARMGPYERAIRRGDLPMSEVGAVAEHLGNYPATIPTLADAQRRIQSDGHAMSNLQITEPRATMLDAEAHWSLYQTMVLDIRR